MYSGKLNHLISAIIIISTSLLSVASMAEKISRFGEYAGYSEERYDGWRRFSQHVTVRDCTRIAIDYYRPTQGKTLHEEKLPVIVTMTRYQRSHLGDGQLVTILDYIPYLVKVLKHGYVVAVADVRGSGASYGSKFGWFPPEEALDSYDVIEWLGTQSWSNGNVGMYSASYLGITQLFAASEAPPHLKAIFPEVAWLDSYSFVYPGGIFNLWPMYSWSTAVQTSDFAAPLPPNWKEIIATERDREAISRAPADCDIMPCVEMGGLPASPMTPVDEDRDGSMLAAATAEHRQSLPDTFTIARSAPFRDSIPDGKANPIHIERSHYRLFNKIKASNIPAYHLGGWFDGFSKDSLFWFRSYPNAEKIVMGPWFHGGFAKFDQGAEYLRWFDYWLKDIDNRVLDEDPIHYYVMGTDEKDAWRSSKTWPLSNEQRTDYFFHSGKSGSVDSINDGILSTVKAGNAGGDRYTADYTTALSVDNRWTLTAGGGTASADRPAEHKPYPDQSENDSKGLTYTTAKLEGPLEVTGHAVAHLWITSTAIDGDFFVYLEEVLPDGKSVYVTEGQLRASHRKLGTPPYDNAGLPYHPSSVADVTPLIPGEATELVIGLQPTSKRFQNGNRIRVTITCADKDTFDTPILDPAPGITLLRDANHASRVVLPLIPRSSGN